MEMIWEKEKGKVTDIRIRYGRSPGQVEGRGILTGRSGRKMKFRTINDAVNHIRKKGWSEVRSFIQCFSGKSVYHFIFKKNRS